MWSQTVGLVNGQYKYLTAETFGHKINANGVGLKKKQQWTLEPFPLDSSFISNGSNYDDLVDQEHVAIKSHLDCYLAVDNFGNVTCESSQLHPGARFTITICSMTNASGDGEQIYWAFRNVERGYFLGATADGMISCQAKMPQSKAELWHVHLVPARGATMFALKSIGRKRYARASLSIVVDGKEQVQVDATSPWGSETLFHFKYFEGGRYALLTSSCKYLTCEGMCIDWVPDARSTSNGGTNGMTVNGKSVSLPPSDCLFTIEYHGGNIAFRDLSGKYLAASGRASTLRSRSNTVSRDELFEFEKCPIQVSLRATFNNRFVSIKQGMDVSANQNEITSSHEVFELQYQECSDTWTIRTKDHHYWSPGAASAIQTNSGDISSAAHFKMIWNQDDGSCSLLVSNTSGKNDESGAKYVAARKSGQLCYSSQDQASFYLLLQNRTSLNLRSANGSGFVGLKVPGSGKLDATKSIPDSILIEYANSDQVDNDEATFNCCYFKMPAINKYWSMIDNNQLACDASSVTCAQQFQLELRTGSTIAIRLFENSSYLNLTKQSSLAISGCQPSEATLWEF